MFIKLTYWSAIFWIFSWHRNILLKGIASTTNSPWPKCMIKRISVAVSLNWLMQIAIGNFEHLVNYHVVNFFVSFPPIPLYINTNYFVFPVCLYHECGQLLWTRLQETHKAALQVPHLGSGDWLGHGCLCCHLDSSDDFVSILREGHIKRSKDFYNF